MTSAEAAITAAVIAGIVSLITALLTALLTLRSAEHRLRAEFKLQFAAERVVHELLSDTRWSLRSFEVIRRHIGGFDDQDLRQILVRAGAIRFESRLGTELWGLLSRNRHRLGVVQLDIDPENPPVPGTVHQG